MTAFEQVCALLAIAAALLVLAAPAATQRVNAGKGRKWVVVAGSVNATNRVRGCGVATIGKAFAEVANG